MIAVGMSVRLKPEVKGSDLAGLIGEVVSTTHFEAQVSFQAQLAQSRIDLWVAALPDVPASDWALVELPVPLHPRRPEFAAKVRVFLPVTEMTAIDQKGRAS